MTKLKRYQVFLADRAKQDLREIHDYILVNFYSQQAADGKVDLLLSALETLELFPEACPLVSSRGYGEMTNDGKTLSLYANRELSRILLYGEAYSVCCSYPKCKAGLGEDFL